MLVAKWARINYLNGLSTVLLFNICIKISLRLKKEFFVEYFQIIDILYQLSVS